MAHQKYQGEDVSFRLVTEDASTGKVTTIYDADNQPRALKSFERLIVDSVICDVASGITADLGVIVEGSEGPLSDYLMDEGSGTTAADSGSRDDAMTLTGDSWGGPVGHESSSFDTAGGTLLGTASDAGLPTGSGAFDYSVWFNSTDSGDYSSLLVIGLDNSGGHTFTIFYFGSDGSIKVEDEENGTVYINNSGSGYNDGVDHFVRLDNDGTTLSLYVDEVLIGTGTPSFDITLQGVFYIGNNSQGSQAYNGLIGRVTLYNAALSTAKGAELFAGGTPLVPVAVFVAGSRIASFSPTAGVFKTNKEGRSLPLGITPSVLATGTGIVKLSGAGRIVAVSQIDPSEQSWQAGQSSNLLSS